MINKKMTNKFAPTLIALSIGLALNVAHAAEEEKDKNEDDMEVISVTGIRGGLEDALNKKRMADQVMDSISAEDIGKFPDDNIAEALQRISGVSIGRDGNGDGDTISIRGMGPDMNKVTFNGQALSSAGGVGNSGQGFSFGVLSADMISALEVYKSPLASQDAGSIGGSVNIRSKKPLELKKTKIQFGIQRGYEELNSDQNSKYTARFISQFFDNTVGLSIGANTSESPGTYEYAGSNNYFNPRATREKINGKWVYSPADIVDSEGNAVAAEDSIMVNGYRIVQRTTNRDKSGADFTLQWRPNEDIDFNLTGLIATQDDNDHQEQFMMGFSANNRLSRTGLADENGYVTEATVVPHPNQRDISLQSWVRTHEKETTSLAASFDWVITDNASLTLQAGTSQGTRWMGQQFDSFLAEGTISYNMNTSDNPRLPDLLIDGIEQMPANEDFKFNGIQNQIKQWEDTAEFVQLDIEYDTGFDFFHTVSGGFKIKEESSSQNVKKAKLRGTSGTMADFYGHDAETVEFYKGTPYNKWSLADWDLIEEVYGKIDDIPFGTEENGYQGDLDITKGTTKAYGTPIENWQVVNDITAFYLQSEFEGDFIFPVRGNIGVRYEETELTSYSFIEDKNANPTAYTPHEVGVKYDDILPSVNISFALNDDLMLRLSGAKVMSRPNARDLSPAYRLSAGVDEESNRGSGTGGNPYLEPFRANQFDLGLEWYFTEGALLAVAYFYKDVESFIAKTKQEQFINDAWYDITVPVNGGEGSIKGLEFNYEQPFTFLPGLLANTGMQFNYTYTDSSSDFVNPISGNTLPMEGMSENTVNSTVYYENKGFSVRIAYTYRDEYLYSGTSHAAVPIFLAPQTYVDAQVNYRLNRYVSFGLKMNNLTDEHREEYIWGGEPDYMLSSYANGRKYRLVMNVNF